MSAETMNLHRNWEAEPPEVVGHYYFSGTITLNGIGFSFEPRSIEVDVVEKEGGGLQVIHRGETREFANFSGLWLGPQPEGTVWE